MKTNETGLSEEIYQLKVTLLSTKPPIWRRLLVPASMTLESLHEVLQLAMGWNNSHLHEFKIGQKLFGRIDLNDQIKGDRAVNERDAHLFVVLGNAGAKAVYTYHFGDWWEHSIVVEKILPPEPGVAYPACAGGKLRCPPDDSGGVAIYYYLLKMYFNPTQENHRAAKRLFGEDYDPAAFSVEEVNRRLAIFQNKVAC